MDVIRQDMTARGHRLAQQGLKSQQLILDGYLIYPCS